MNDDGNLEEGGGDDGQSGHRENDELAEVRREQAALGAELARLTALRGAMQPRPEPKEVHHAIALGSVLARLGLVAADSWKLDGALAGSVDGFLGLVRRGAAELPGKNAGATLVRALHLDGSALHAKGQAAAWRRKYRAYLAERDAWLAVDARERTQGAWRAKPPSASQVALVQVTCAILKVAVPALRSRGGAHDWLDASGANLRYPQKDG